MPSKQPIVGQQKDTKKLAPLENEKYIENCTKLQTGGKLNNNNNIISRRFLGREIVTYRKIYNIIILC